MYAILVIATCIVMELFIPHWLYQSQKASFISISILEGYIISAPTSSKREKWV